MKTKRTILHITTNYTQNGGIGHWLLNTIPAKSQNYSHSLCIIGRSRADELKDSPKSRLKFEKIIDISMPFVLWPLQMFKLIIVVLKIRPKLVIIHQGWLGAITALLCALCLVRTRILYFHTGDWDHARGVIKDHVALVLVGLGKVIATDFWFASEGCKEKWLKKTEVSRVAVVQTGIELLKGAVIEKSVARRKLGLSDNAFVIGHVGRFTEPKNHEFIIAVMHEILKKEANCILLLVGDGPLRENINNKARQLGLLNNVIFLGTRTDVFACLSAMDVFIFPSHYESLGISVLEAQVVGLPVVTSNVPGLSEAIAPCWSQFSHSVDDVESFVSSVLSLKTTERYIPTAFLEKFSTETASANFEAKLLWAESN
ncbi:MAG: glycosyltransferase [Fibrobacteres bacterium]|nr:glycosyltransferase [Fibrobacterota bacterium]